MNKEETIPSDRSALQALLGGEGMWTPELEKEVMTWARTYFGRSSSRPSITVGMEIPATLFQGRCAILDEAVLIPDSTIHNAAVYAMNTVDPPMTDNRTCRHALNPAFPKSKYMPESDNLNE